MKLKVTLLPPVDKDDFWAVLRDLKKREETPVKNRSASYLRQQLMRTSGPFQRLARMALSSPLFNSWAEKTVQKYKVLSSDPETMTIIYDYDTSPVTLETLQAGFFDLSKKMNKNADILLMMENASRKMWRDSLTKEGLPKECVIVERV